MCPERSVIMSLISDLPGDCWKTGVGRVAVDFGAGQGAKRSADIRSDLGQASNAGQRQNQRNPRGREAEGQLAPKAFGAGRVVGDGNCITDAGGVADISRWCKPPVTHTRYDEPR